MLRYLLILLVSVAATNAGLSAALAEPAPPVQITPEGRAPLVDPCRTVRCPSGQRCLVRGETAYCVADAPGETASVCDARPCPPGLRCNPLGDGGFCCIAGADDSGASSSDGRPNPCAGLRCPPGQRCVSDGARARCVGDSQGADPCATLRCGPAQRCVLAPDGSARCVGLRERTG